MFYVLFYVLLWYIEFYVFYVLLCSISSIVLCHIVVYRVLCVLYSMCSMFYCVLFCCDILLYIVFHVFYVLCVLLIFKCSICSIIKKNFHRQRMIMVGFNCFNYIRKRIVKLSHLIYIHNIWRISDGYKSSDQITDTTHSL